MPGQAAIRINENEWAVSLATTYAELVQGLSGVASMPAGTGMLFVLPADQAASITTQPLLFNIDIIFISSDLKVVDVAKNIAPGNIVTESTLVRYFLEVNDGEASSIESGDMVGITIFYQPATNTLTNWISPLFSFAGLMAVGVFMVSIGRSITKAMLGEPSERLLPKTEKPQGGTCYEDAWRFLLREEEGELLHGSVESQGKRIKHAWVELPTGYIWEPENKLFIRIAEFKTICKPQEDSRYSATEAAIMAARTKNFGPWSEEEKKQFLKEKSPAVKPSEYLPQVSTETRLDSLQIVKAYKEISAHGKDKISVSLQAWAIFPRGRRPHFISMYRSGDEYVIQPLYGHIAEWVRIPVEKVKAWIRSLPVRHFEPMAVTPELREEAEKLAKEVDKSIDIIPLPSRESVAKFEPGQIVYYKGERVRVLEHIGDRVQIFIPSRQEEVWVTPEKLERITTGESPAVIPTEKEMARVLAEIDRRPKKDITESKLRQEFGDPMIESLRSKGYVIGFSAGPNPPLIVTLRGREVTKVQTEQPALIPTEPRPRREGDLEYLADSPEFLTQTIEAIGYRDKLDTTFQEAIARAKGLR